MKSNFLIYILCLLLFNVCLFNTLKAAERNDSITNTSDSLTVQTEVDRQGPLKPYHLNVIKFNPTPMWMWEQPQNVTFSYERLIKPNHSMSFLLGYLTFPQVLKDTVFNTLVLGEYSTKGINIALDYRYYPWQRNMRPAPDGFYLGGYLSFNGNAFENQFKTVNLPVDEPGSFKGNASMTNLGFEIGYQFIFWKRFSLDLLMFGPSITLYNRNLELTGIDNQNILDQIDEELADKLLEKFPALGMLFNGETSTYSSSNVVLSTAFRYSFQIGYHF